MINHLKSPFGHSTIYWFKTKWIHIISWIIFTIYESVVVGSVRGHFGTVPNYIIHYSINITLFYFHADIILDFCFQKLKQLWIIIILTVLEILIYILLVYSIDYFLVKFTNILEVDTLTFNKSLVFGYLWRALYFMLFSTGYYFFIRYKKERDEKELAQKQQLEAMIIREQMAKELTQAKNAFILAQVNPHFLFNTLNHIYYSTYQESPVGARSIMLLSKIMHYAANIENASTFVNLSQEIVYVENLIEIHQLRYNHTIKFDFSYQDSVKDIKIIPLVLITIAENIFKHGDFTHQNYMPFITISIDKNNSLIIESGNIRKASYRDKGLKSGLNNVSSRLNLAYSGTAKLNYHLNEIDYFNINLSIPINSLNAYAKEQMDNKRLELTNN